MSSLHFILNHLYSGDLQEVKIACENVQEHMKEYTLWSTFGMQEPKSYEEVDLINEYTLPKATRVVEEEERSEN